MEEMTGIPRDVTTANQGQSYLIHSIAPLKLQHNSCVPICDVLLKQSAKTDDLRIKEEHKWLIDSVGFFFDVFIARSSGFRYLHCSSKVLRRCN